MTATRAEELIDSGKSSHWNNAWKVKDSYPSYSCMLLNPFIWTFNQAYPDLEKRLREL